MKKFDQWFFGPQTATTLGVFRAVVGGLAFLALLALTYSFSAFYTEQGVWPADYGIKSAIDIPQLNLLFGVTNPILTWGFLFVTIIAAFMSCIGLFTRWSLLVLFIGVVTLNHRSPDILNSGDTLIRQWIFILLISPSGKAFSVDRLLEMKKKGDLTPEVISSWPLKLVQIELAIIYFTTAWHKWNGETWKAGIATLAASQLREFERFPLPPFFLSQPAVNFSTYYTLIIEVALGTVVFWKPLRGWTLLGGLLLHASIEYSFNIPFFAYIITAGYMCFYKGEEMEGFLARVKDRLPFGNKSQAAPIEPASST